MQLKDFRVEPRLVKGPSVIHVHNGGIDKLKPGRVWREVKVPTLVTVWVRPSVDELDDLEPQKRRRKLTRSERAYRQLGCESRSEARRTCKELARDQAAEQKTLELALRERNITWRQAEKLCGGVFPATLDEFLAKHVKPEPAQLPLAA